MGQLESKVYDILSASISNLDCELYGCEYVAGAGKPVLRLFIDKENGVSLADCQLIMDFVSPLLDVEDVMLGEYNLEVSSPGANRRLFVTKHYVSQIGNNIKVKLKLPLNGQRNFKGKLLAVVDNSIKLEVDGDTHAFIIDNIDKANLLASK